MNCTGNELQFYAYNILPGIEPRYFCFDIFDVRFKLMANMLLIDYVDTSTECGNIIEKVHKNPIWTLNKNSTEYRILENTFKSISNLRNDVCSSIIAGKLIECNLKSHPSFQVF